MATAPVLPYRAALFQHKVDIDIGCPHNDREQICMCQGDSDAAREIECTLYRNGEVWTPPEGTTVRIHYETPVGGKSYYTQTKLGRMAWKIDGNVLTFAIGDRVNNHIGITKVHLELDYNGLTIRSPQIEVNVHADLHAREPRFYQDEYVGHIYFAMCGVNSETDPFEVWYPVYLEHKRATEKMWEEGSVKTLDAEVTVIVDKEEIPEQEVVGSGSLVDPIHYDGSLYLIRDLYYLQDNVVYQCVLGTRVPARYKLVDLVGLYVEKVKVIPAAGPAGTRNDPIQFVETTTLERRKFYIEKGALYLAISTTSYHPKSLRSCSVALPVADLEDMLN